jgi:DNA-binding NarL/FixJ family response regulator
MSNTIRILLVDDHPVVRYGLKALLDGEDDIEVAGIAGSGLEALKFLEQNLIHVILLDLRMPKLSGIETLQKIKLIAPLARTIILSSYELDEEIHSAVLHGARGYVHKEAPAEVILQAIRSVYRGQEAFPARIASRLQKKNMSFGLSAREIEILQLIAKGLTNKEVGSILKLSQFTIRNHMNRITEKMDVSDRTEAIYRAIESGIITLH